MLKCVADFDVQPSKDVCAESEYAVERFQLVTFARIHLNYKTTSLFRLAPFSDPNYLAGWRQTPIIIAQQPSGYDVMTVRAATLVTDTTRDVGGEEPPFIAAAVLFRNLDESINLGLRPVAIDLVFTWSCVSVKVRIRILTQHTFRVIARLFTLGRFTVLATSSV